jgi:hypothetical protein
VIGHISCDQLVSVLCKPRDRMGPVKEVTIMITMTGSGTGLVIVALAALFLLAVGGGSHHWD